ncbi:MAG: PAS domain S-box protein, partial [Acholeplasmataceae bacterium]|nr:PAS domain S-box protein [Acholeplasmataceae bacterium]
MGKEANENYLKRELYDLVKSDDTLFDFIQEGSLDGMWYWNLENIEDEWLSPRFWEVLGYDPKEKTHHSKEWQDIIFKDDLKEATDNFYKHLQNPKYPYDQIVRYKHKDGSTVWIRCRGIAIRDKSGKPIRMLGAHTNITDIKQQEKGKMESEEKYRLLYETMTQGVVYQNSDGYITSANSSAEKILGLSLSQMQGKTSMDPRWKMIDEYGKSIPGENHPAMIALRTGNKVGPVVCGVYHPEDNRYVWLSIIAIPLFANGDEKPNQVYATFEDITEKRVADAEVAYRKNLLQYVIGHGNQGIAVHDKNLNYVYVSDKYCDMYHVDKDIIGKHHYEIFPDLPQKWRDVHQRTLKGETLKGDRDIFKRADGSIEYTRWLSQPWYDQDGEIAGIIIYTEVINELVNTEVQLQKTVDQLQRVMDNLTIGIAVNSVDPEVEFEYMNDNFPIFYGTTRERLMKAGSFWDEVYEDEIFREEIKQKVLTGLASDDPKLKRWEYVPITKNGKIVRYITAQGVNVPNSPLIISMVMDVTEQKQREEDIIYTSNHDFLTRLPNRKYFEERLIELDQQQFLPLLV